MISSFLVACMAHQTKVKFGLKARKSSQNAMLTVTTSTMGYSFKQSKHRVFELIISRKIFLLPVVGNATANVHLIILSLLLCMSFDSSSLVPYYHATNHPYKWVQTIHNVENWEGKSLYHPLTYGGGLHNPSTYKTVYITPLNFPKPIKLPPKVVLKNHNKS